MTAGTLNSQAQEQLGRVFHLLVGLFDLAIPGHGRILPDLAGGRQHLRARTGRRACWHTSCRGSSRGTRTCRGRRSDRDACCAESSSTCWRSSRHNRCRPAACRSTCRASAGRRRPGTARVSAGVGKRPAMSIAVRRRKVESSHTAEGGSPNVFSFLKDQVVDEVLRRGQAVDRGAQRHVGAKHADLPLVAGHDRHVAGERQRLDQPGRADFGHFGVVRLELGRAGHVFGRTVRIVGHGQYLLLALLAHRALGGKHVDLRHRRRRRRRRRACPAESSAASADKRANPAPDACRRRAGQRRSV